MANIMLAMVDIIVLLFGTCFWISPKWTAFLACSFHFFLVLLDYLLGGHLRGGQALLVELPATACPLSSPFFSQHQQDRLGWGLPGDDADLAEDEVRWGSIHAAGQCYASVQFPALKFRISQDKQPISFPCAVEVEVVLFCYLSSRIFVVY